MRFLCLYYLMTNKTMDELIEDNRFSSDVSDYIGNCHWTVNYWMHFID